MNLKFYTSVAKTLKVKVRKFWGLFPTFLEVTGEKLVEGAFCTPPSPPILIRVKSSMLAKVNILNKLGKNLPTDPQIKSESCSESPHEDTHV